MLKNKYVQPTQYFVGFSTISKRIFLNQNSLSVIFIQEEVEVVSIKYYSVNCEEVQLLRRAFVKNDIF